jgi:hypothetical protein
MGSLASTTGPVTRNLSSHAEKFLAGEIHARRHDEGLSKA